MPAQPSIAHPLLPFARSGEGPVRSLEATAERDGADALRFRYLLDADLSAIRIPPLRAPRQADELWKHTCFEAFVARSSGGSEYLELNFSPSTEWAAYAFESYRKGMTPLAPSFAPRIEATQSGSLLSIDVHVATRGLLPEHWREARSTLRVALSAVIEDDRGRISYWALRHAPDKPDFHHAAGFILEV